MWEFRSLTRDQIWAPYGGNKVLTIGPPGKSQDSHFLTFIVSFGTVIAPAGESFSLLVFYNGASHVALAVKNLPANAGDIRDVGSIPGLGRSPGEGNGNPLQYSCLENPMDRGAWWATVHRTAKSRTQLEQLSTRTQLKFIHSHSCVVLWYVIKPGIGASVEPQELLVGL